jgi:hypothetical protein
MVPMARDPFKAFRVHRTGASAAVAPLPDVLIATTVPTVLLMLVDR